MIKKLVILVVVLAILIEVDSEDGLDLQCHGTGIFVSITTEFLEEAGVDIRFADQIFFRNFPNCSALQTENGYSLTIPAPFDSCGTILKQEPGSYIYTNEILIVPLEIVQNGVERGLNRIPIQCSYDDRYVVSSEFGLKPYVKTIYFETAKGNISVDMNLYQRKDYHPKSRLGARPMVLVSFPLYVSVSMDNIFGDAAMTTTLENCYASDQSSYKDMDSLLHYLVQGRCTSRMDTTVEIYQNGKGNEARFKFDMFRWRSSKTEFVYLHCEVKVCNSTKEKCSGSGPQCNGLKMNPWSFVGGRKKRNVEFDARESGITSIGPIAIGDNKPSGEGEAKLETDTLRDKEFLATYIYLAVGIVLLVFIVVATTTLVCKRSKQIKKQKRQAALASSKSDTSSDSFNQNHLPICF